VAPGVSNPTHPGGAGDMFLRVKGAAHGLISGEAQDDKHKNEIEVLSWSWGIQGRPSLGGGGASGKATIRELRIFVRVAVGGDADRVWRAAYSVRKAPDFRRAIASR